MTETETPMLPMIVWWHDNQVAVTFLSTLPFDAGASAIIKSLHLNRLNQFLEENGFKLTSFKDQDVPHPLSRDDDEEHSETLLQEGIEALRKVAQAVGEEIEEFGEKVERLGGATHDSTEKHRSRGHEGTGDEDEQSKHSGLNSPTGKYLFHPPAGQGTNVIAFFHIERTSGGAAKMVATPPPRKISQDKSGQNKGMDMYPENDDTLTVVKLINNNLGGLKEREIPIVSAMPNWLNGGTPWGCGTHGCPTDPPIAVTSTCPATPDDWPFTIAANLPEGATGSGVRVFVLDTLPIEDQIKSAAGAANPVGGPTNNALLKRMVSGMGDALPFKAIPPAINVNYNILPNSLDAANPEQPATGKDIYGRLVGFPLADHGLFVAGVVRSIAPGANIECIRVLNDEGVGDADTLISALNDIQSRITVQSPVVINFSLVVTPYDDVLGMEPYNLTPTDIEHLRDGIRVPIASLANNFGVTFVTSAGNDSDLRDPMNPTGTRFGPRYPAEFAYNNSTGSPIPNVVPVGAVKGTTGPASYSNYPGTYGIATYGGEGPTPLPATPDPSVITTIDPEVPIDAVVGVYSSLLYPSLSKDDKQQTPPPPPNIPPEPIMPPYPEKPAPNRNAWAYWSGTSFATPVISGLAALVLEGQSSTTPSFVHDQIVTAAAGQTTQWDRLDPSASPTPTAPGPLIMASQCQFDTGRGL